MGWTELDYIKLRMDRPQHNLSGGGVESLPFTGVDLFPCNPRGRPGILSGGTAGWRLALLSFF